MNDQIQEPQTSMFRMDVLKPLDRCTPDELNHAGPVGCWVFWGVIEAEDADEAQFMSSEMAGGLPTRLHEARD